MTKRSVTKKPKLTKWFDGSVKPVRDGVYQRKYRSDSEVSAFWMFRKGRWIFGGAIFPNAVRLDEDRASLDQDFPWRGLAQNPEVQP